MTETGKAILTYALIFVLGTLAPPALVLGTIWLAVHAPWVFATAFSGVVGLFIVLTIPHARTLRHSTRRRELQ